MVLDRFHPAVSAWFLSAHTCPTEPQARGWSAIQARRHTLIAAPTGSGKTLAAFLSAIDDLVRQAEGPGLPAKTQVLYISPLKALGNDIQKNLSEPLAGISAEMIRLGRPAPDIRVAVRSGDTPQMERAAMLRRAPHILVTTPESCYLLLTSPRGRNLLRSVRTVIVDEIHALVGNKRGSHLALSLERLDALCDSPPVRIGLSATQRPIEEVARFLVGRGPGWNPEREPLLALAEAASGVAPSEAPFPPPVPPEPEAQPCQIVDSGHVRTRDLGLELPASPLEPVMSGEIWTEVYDRLAALVREHRTTLVFVNTRRLAERVARHLSERLGPEAVTAHHGSMAKEHRLEAEQRLKSGKLRALVATASLELGIDVGAVELVCQIGATRSIAAFLQRVGRSGHSLGALPKGRLFPLSRDELVECTALLDAVRREELDHILMPQAPLDVLAQQIVAAASVEEWDQETLYRCVTRAWPYRTLSRREFDAVVTMLARGFTTRRGRAAAYLHHDAVNGRVRARPTARAAALMNGGAIPDNALFDVVQEPTETFIGTVGEDFAIESLPGDVFQLGNASWRILRVDLGKLRVEDAQGQPPTLPFWEGDAPGRTDELSLAVSRLREEVAERLGTPGSAPAPEVLPSGAISFVTPESPVVRWLMAEKGLDGPAALQLAEYLASIRAALGVMPTQRTLVTERFFDEGGGMQMVIHSPFGSRLNRAWGLALRKRFCRQFNFELQAAATEDAIVLSLGPSHSFPLEEVYRYLRSATAREVLVQALLDAPMFPLRWRHNANRALAVLRRQYGRKIPPQWQRMRANDLLALVFPDQQACLENIVGDREVPDHPLVNQTLRDCLEEVMDIDGLERLLRAMESGALELVARDLREPSPLAAEILNAKPYAFLDDAPLEERRTRAVSTRRWLDPETASTLGALDAQAIALVRAEAWPGLEGRAPTPDDLHDALMQLGLVSAMEMAHLTGASSGNLGDALSESPLVASLLAGGRLTRLHLHPSEPSGIPPAPGDGVPRPLPYWAAAEWLPVLRQSHPGAVEHPVLLLPPTLRNQAYTPDEARRELVRARLEVAGPVRLESLAALVALPPPEVTQALAELESEGAVFRGRYTPGVTEEEWCDRGLLARIHRYTLDRLRREIEPVSTADYLRFLLDWQRLTPGRGAEGVEGLAGVVALLEGFEAPAAAWEPELLAARMPRYKPEDLDRLCAMGRVAWVRLTPPAGGGTRRGGPVASTPITLLERTRLGVWMRWRRGNPSFDATPLSSLTPADSEPELSADARTVREELERRGASFFSELVEHCGLLPTRLETALGELVALGRVTADSFAGLRALLQPAHRKASPRRLTVAGLGGLGAEGAGRWARLPHPASSPTLLPSELPAQGREEVSPVAHLAWVLLRRYGVVYRRVLEREPSAPPWRDLLREYRRLEARGEIRGGRFVSAQGGEQFALPEAVGSLRELRRKERTGALLSVSAADPLNLVGILTPGVRVAAVTGNRVLFRDGEPIAVLEGGTPRYLVPVPPGEEWVLRNALLGRNVSPLPLGTGEPRGE